MRGIASTNSTALGALHGAIRLLAYSITCCLLSAVGALHHRVHPADPLLIGDSDPHDIGDAGVPDQSGLHLCRKDIHAPMSAGHRYLGGAPPLPPSPC